MGGLWPDGSVANRIQVTKGGFVLILFVVIASVITKRLLIGQNYRQILYAQPINRRIEMSKITFRDISDTPWRLHEGGTSVVNNKGGLVAACGFLPGRSVFEERANAKLISLAPDLIEALIELACVVENKNNGCHSGSISLSTAIAILKQVDAWEDY